MELCKKELSELIANGQQFSRADLAHFAYSFIKGLSELKKKQIYHRDIKPENIMIGYDNEFKLIDFNISVVSERNSEMAGIGPHSNKGTLNYSSPEKFNCPENEHSLELNDAYSLGLVILEMSTLEVISIHRMNKELFIQKREEQIRQIEIPWLSNLIREMLTYDYRYRPRFGRLLEMIEQDREFVNDRNRERSNFI
ncbi:TSSK1B [Blepharisma stoltei]|uniref:Protein kinase domain-containing protein n=1 Tax=Blepharisma stoltei TaxID=1481888 RepID=A0AAU9JY22_9CILI|nr:unnamed protein product [Blepharisma stoltei]